MSLPPLPLVFSPILKPRPWGGRRLGGLGRALPPNEPIGESWELSDLPGDESRVARGPLAGKNLSELITLWGPRLTGHAPLLNGRFPLLIKFLDAREPLSVQVHPRPDLATFATPAKDEAWVILDAEPDAALWIGLRPGATVEALSQAVRGSAVAQLLHRWPVRRGDCFFLPSGTPHALGGGIVVCEVQTPSDTTFRLYDWERRDAQGRPRTLHVEEALRHVRADVSDEQVRPPRRHLAGVFTTVTRLVSSDRFLLDRLRIEEAVQQSFPHGEPVVWVVISGAGRMVRAEHVLEFGRGDVILVPADGADIRFEARSVLEVIEVRIPVLSHGLPLPRSVEQPGGGSLIRLTRPNPADLD